METGGKVSVKDSSYNQWHSCRGNAQEISEYSP